MSPIPFRLPPPYRLLPILLCMCLSAGCASRTALPPNDASEYAKGQLVLPDGRQASERKFLLLAERADYILIGERHDNALDHSVQAAVLASLARNGMRPLLGLEMLPRNRFERELQAITEKKIKIDDIPQALDWENSWGFDFALYRPAFAVVQQYGIPVYGLNISNDVRLSLSRKGLAALSDEERGQLPERVIPPLPEQREKLAEVFRIHEAMFKKSRKAASSQETSLAQAVSMPSPTPGRKTTSSSEAGWTAESPDPSKALERFLLVQSVWDSTMAEQAALVRQWHQEQPDRAHRPLVILAGSGHVEFGHGIAHRLLTLDPQARILSIMPFSGRKPKRGAADLFYYSPQQKEKRGFGFTLEPVRGGVSVVAVRDGSRAARSGMREGDVIVEADGRAVREPGDLHRAAMRAGEGLTLGVDRQGKRLQIPLGGNN